MLAIGNVALLSIIWTVAHMRARKHHDVHSFSSHRQSPGELLLGRLTTVRIQHKNTKTIEIIPRKPRSRWMPLGAISNVFP